MEELASRVKALEDQKKYEVSHWDPELKTLAKQVASVIAAQQRGQRDHMIVVNSLKADVDKNKLKVAKALSLEDLNMMEQKIIIEVKEKTRKFDQHNGDVEEMISSKLNEFEISQQEWKSSIEMAIFDGMNRNRENIELHHDILDRIDKKLANTIEGRDSDMLMLDSSLGEITEKLEDGQQERVQLKAQQKSSEQLIEKTRASLLLEKEIGEESRATFEKHCLKFEKDLSVNVHPKMTQLCQTVEELTTQLQQKSDENSAYQAIMMEQVQTSNESARKAVENATKISQEIKSATNAQNMTAAIVKELEDKLKGYLKQIKLLETNMGDQHEAIEKQYKEAQKSMRVLESKLLAQIGSAQAVQLESLEKLRQEQFEDTKNLKSMDTQLDKANRVLQIRLQEAKSEINELAHQCSNFASKIKVNANHIAIQDASLQKHSTWQFEHTDKFSDIQLYLKKEIEKLITKDVELQCTLDHNVEKASAAQTENTIAFVALKKDLADLSVFVEDLAAKDTASASEDKLSKSSIAIAQVYLKHEHFYPDGHVDSEYCTFSDCIQTDMAKRILELGHLLNASLTASYLKLVIQKSNQPYVQGKNSFMHDLDKLRTDLLTMAVDKVNQIITKLTSKPTASCNTKVQEMRISFEKKLGLCLEQLIYTSSYLLYHGNASRPLGERSLNEKYEGGLFRRRLDASCIACDRPLDYLATGDPNEDIVDNDSLDKSSRQNRVVSSLASKRIDTVSPIGRRSGDNPLTKKTSDEPISAGKSSAYVYRGGFRLPKDNQSPNVLEVTSTQPIPRMKKTMQRAQSASRVRR